MQDSPPKVARLAGVGRGKGKIIQLNKKKSNIIKLNQNKTNQPAGASSEPPLITSKPYIKVITAPDAGPGVSLLNKVFSSLKLKSTDIGLTVTLSRCHSIHTYFMHVL